MNQEEIFDSLTRNAFDFLEQGIKDFDKAPKYSVIHFCAAVEMLLKARLMKEHWALIVSKPEQANLAKFIAGDFMSVTLEDSRARLRDVAGEDIGDDAYGSFRVMANHRNKMVHFFHPYLDTDDEAKAQIVAEHCRAWFHLHRLLNRWTKYFQEFRSEIEKANSSMNGHREYLGAKFAALKPELDAARKAGKEPITCGACAHEAAVPEKIDRQISSLRCLVCDHIETQVEIDCPRCSKRIVIANEGFASCVHCGKEIEPEHVFDALEDHDAAHMAARDGDDGWQPANCSNCHGYQMVVRRDDHYFCASCFEFSEQVEQCECCGDFSTGDMENSYWYGCEHCDGKAGWEKDK